jgi:phosphate transport system substrate-binding protein
MGNITSLIKEFTKLHPGVSWQGMDDVGSDAGIKLVLSGDIDLSFISRELRPAEVGTVMTVPIGATGTGIAVNSSNPITGLSKDQLANIFRGDITDWNAVGGAAGPIHVLMRETGAATRMAFESYFFGGKPPTSYAKNAIEVVNYDETVKAMKNLSGSIGIMSLSAQSFNEPSIHFLSVDGIPPTRQTLANGSYPMRRPLYLVYSTDPTKIKPAIKAFIDWVKGPEGQRVLDSL